MRDRAGVASTRESLEHQLRERWSTAALEVYADHLMSIADPLGELIAMDVRPTADTSWRLRRTQLLSAWLGADVAARAGHRVQHGVVYEMRAPRDVPLLATPLGDVVRGFSAWETGRDGHTHDELVKALEALVAKPRPWLTRIAIEYATTTPLAPKLRDAFVAATPNLVELYAVGQRLFDELSHPSLARLYVSPASLQQPVTGRPATNARVIETWEDGYAGDRLAQSDDLKTLLEAIDVSPHAGALYEHFADLVGPHDSLPAMITRMNEAGIVELDGPFIRVSSVGRVLARWPEVEVPHRPRPARMPPAVVGERKWVLWVESADRPGAERLIAGLVWMQAELLADALGMLPLDETTHQVLTAYVAFLADVIDAGEWTNVVYPGALEDLVRALRQPLAFHEVTRYGVAMLAYVGDRGEWTRLQRLVDTLDRISGAGDRALFRVAWGF